MWIRGPMGLTWVGWVNHVGLSGLIEWGVLGVGEGTKGGCKG